MLLRLAQDNIECAVETYQLTNKFAAAVELHNDLSAERLFYEVGRTTLLLLHSIIKITF